MEISIFTISPPCPQLTRASLNVWFFAGKKREKFGLKALALLFCEFFTEGCSQFLQQGERSGNEGNLLYCIETH